MCLQCENTATALLHWLAARPHRIIGLDRNRPPLALAAAEGVREVRGEGPKLPAIVRVRRQGLILSKPIVQHFTRAR